MKDRSETSGLLKTFVAMTKTQFGNEVKIIRSDSGFKFTSGTMLQYFAENGIIRQTTCVRTPQQNNRVE